MESLGAASPGILVLTTSLSRPFRRVDKYANILQEFERHLDESHSDRGDCQRSVAIYKNLDVSDIFFSYQVYYSLFSKRFFDTFTKAEINSWNFYEKIQNMLINIMKHVKNASRAIIAQNNVNASGAFPIF